MANDFGENIDKSLFQDDMIDLAKKIRNGEKKLYKLPSVKEKMSPNPDKYVFIATFCQHASVVVVDKELFENLFFSPIFGQMIIGQNLQMKVNFKRLKDIPWQQYHVRLDETKTNYILAKNLYYVIWFRKSRSFYAGETALSYTHLELLCLLVAPSKYKLVLDDCLEFAKRFVREIAVNERRVSEQDLMGLFKAIKVSDGFVSAAIEGKSRHNKASAMSAALSYFSSFNPKRIIFVIFVFVIFVFVIIIIIYIYVANGYKLQHL